MEVSKMNTINKDKKKIVEDYIEKKFTGFMVVFFKNDDVTLLGTSGKKVTIKLDTLYKAAQSKIDDKDRKIIDINSLGV